MRDFIKKNRVIFPCFCMSALICIIYIFTLDQKEWFPHAGDWFGLLFQLSVGFIINFIFFVTQIYIPQYKQNREANRCIHIRINGIVGHMREIFSQLGNKYMGKYDENNVSDEYCYELLKKINVNDRIGVLNVRRMHFPIIDENAHFTVKEWIISRVDFVESETDKLLKYYAPYIDTELMVTLEDILKSAMHQNMVRSLLQLPSEIYFESANNDIFLFQYYKLMKKLESVSEKYKQ